MNIALILSGGTGSRLGLDIPKQYIKVGGKPVIAYSLEEFQKNEQIDCLQIVAEETWQKEIMVYTGNKFCGFSSPGKNRQLSILHGLRDIMNYAKEADNVVIHDAARPFVSGEIIRNCLKQLAVYEGVLPALPLKDTVYCGLNGKVVSLLDRDSLILGQSPEAFRLGIYYKANEALIPDKILGVNGSTEPAVMAGMNVCYIAGEEKNFKITTMNDLERFRQIVEVGGHNIDERLFVT